MAKDVLKAMAEMVRQKAIEDARRITNSCQDILVSEGFQKEYTPEELEEIERRRIALRKRLFAAG